jgi:ACS family tartrate transporter-like MFS transporter
MTLGESAAAAAVGFINSFGSLGSFVGPTVVGFLLTAEYPFSVAVGVLSLCFLLASVTTVILGARLSAPRQEKAIGN